MSRTEIVPKRLAAAAGHGKPPPPHLDGNRKNCIEGYSQLTLRSDDLLKAPDGPSKLTSTTLPGRRPAAAGGDSRDLPGHGGGLRRCPSGGAPTVRNLLKRHGKNIARRSTRGR